MSLVGTKKYCQFEDFDFVLGKIHERGSRQGRSLLKSFVYGGYVRDTLRGEQFQDMDIRVPCLEVAKKFIDYLEESQRLIYLEEKKPGASDIPSVDYKTFSMVIQTHKTAELKIDISYSAAQVLGENSLNNCDFTANNLMMDIDGNISTRIKACQIGRASEFTEDQWTAKCIRDCIQGKLVWMIPDRFSKILGGADKITFMEKMHMRLDKMLKKGFVLTDEHLTSFRLLNLRPIESLPQQCEATMCSICHENYADTCDKPTAVSKCSHHFHTGCIQKWIEKKKEERQRSPVCPCCRQEIVLYY